MSGSNIDRNLSQYHRPHLSINDVDFASIPRPGRNLRQVLQSPRRDSRFYSTMPSEDEIRTFPGITSESLAGASFVHTSGGQAQQWLNPSKSKDLEKRKKKAIQLSISAPMARFPMSAITEQTESVRQGSPEAVELPAHTTPKVTLERFTAVDEPLPAQHHHPKESSIDGTIGTNDKHEYRISTRINNGNAIKSRSISMGSIAPPPNFPLPPVPESKPILQARQPSLSRSISGHSTACRDISLLNSPMKNPLASKSTIITVQPSGNFSGFNFDLDRDAVQVVRVEKQDAGVQQYSQNATIYHADLRLKALLSAETSCQNTGSKNDFTHEWNLPVGLRHLGPTKAQVIAEKSYLVGRPVSIISDSPSDGPLNSHRPSPVKADMDGTSRPVSVSSVDFFRQSVIGPNAPVLPPKSPRTKGHKRQNCIRISGLTPIDQAKKRLSSQLDRLAEAEEPEGEDGVCVGTKTSTISPTENKHVGTLVSTTSDNANTLHMCKIRQPQARSLRVRRSGLLDRGGSIASPTKSESDVKTVSPPIRPSNPITRSKTVEPRFVYAGSPSSDPTRPPPPQQEYSPVSPSASLSERPCQAEGDSSKLDAHRAIETQILYSLASTSILFSATSSPAATISSGSPKRHSQLHGPRNAPPPSLRTRNGTYISPHLRQVADKKSGSPIRKTSQSENLTITSRRSSVSMQDELHRKIALLKGLTHAATVGKAGGLPEINLVKATVVPSSNTGLVRTPSSRYVDSPLVVTDPNLETKAVPPHVCGPRQRSKTVGATTLVLPKLRQEATYPANHGSSPSHFPTSPSNISIWEDASVRGDSDNDSPQASRRSQNLEKLMHRRSKTAVPSFMTTTIPLEKGSLWKLQQNADVITSRALAFNDNRNPSGSAPSSKSSKQNSKERKISKLDGFWADKSQYEPKLPVQSPTRIRVASDIMGPRQRSQTVSAAPPKARYTQLSTFKTEQGVGLGLDFGRPMPASALRISAGRKSGSGGPVFLNDMERDGIGKLR